MSEIVFRKAHARDLAAIVALLADDDLGRGRETPPDNGVAPGYLRAFDAMARSPDNVIVVAEHEKSVIGCLQLIFVSGITRGGARRAIIEAVRVSASARGLGVGQAMMEYAIEEARSAGCRLVQLTSDRRRTRAHEFYRRLGFEDTHVGFKLELSPGTQFVRRLVERVPELEGAYGEHLRDHEDSAKPSVFMADVARFVAAASRNPDDRDALMRLLAHFENALLSGDEDEGDLIRSCFAHNLAEQSDAIAALNPMMGERLKAEVDRIFAVADEDRP